MSGFVVTDILHRTMQTEDDGTAMFLLTAGQQVLRVMEEPLRVQNYLRNIMDVTFDSTAGASPAEQYEKLREAYSDIAQVCDPAKLPQQEENRVFQIRNLFGLRFLVLALYFEQDNQRICRCDYCWGYFIPKTKKVTRYCDRIQFFCTRIFSLLYSHSASRKASFKIESGVLKWQKGAMMSDV